MSFAIKRVETRRDKRTFLDVARELYRGDANWICPLDREIEKIFNPSRNPYFLHGTAERWVLTHHEKPVGRIAAFIDERKTRSANLAAGGIGFFECIDDHDAALLLFDTAAEWLKSKNVAAMDGPINFGENDRYWGLLVEGFTETPFTTNYNKPYYRKLFEEYGFQVYYEMFTSQMGLRKSLDERMARIGEWIKKKNNVSFAVPTKRSLSEFAGYFREIYNEAWQFHEGFAPMTTMQAQTFAKDIKQVLIPELVPFAFVGDQPVGFIAALPDLNQIFKPWKGKAGILRLLLFKWRSRNGFSWYLRKGILTRIHAIAIGVKPRFQLRGLETGMILHSLPQIKSMGFETVELRWAGDFNEKPIRLHEAVGAERVRKHITWRYMFNGSNVTAPKKLT